MDKKVKKVLLALPTPLVKQLDAISKKEHRTRTAEVRMRLEASFVGGMSHAPTMRRASAAAK